MMQKLLFFLCFAFLSVALTAQIVNIEELRITGTNDSLRWYGMLKANCNLSKVKDRTLFLRGESRVQYKRRRNIWLLLLNTDFLRAGNKNFTNANFAHLRYNRKLTDSFAWELFGQQQTNRLILIKSRSLVGTGFRKRFWVSQRQNSRLYLGTAYLYEHNVLLENYGQPTWHRLSNYLSFTVRNKKSGAMLQATTYWQPVIGQIKNYRFSSEWTLELPITKHLRFSTDFAYSLDKGLPAAAPLSIYAWQNGLVWRL